MLSSIAALLLTEGCLFSGKVSSLDAFRSYPKQLSGSACPVGQLINQRLRCPVPLVLWATSPQTTTPLSGRDRPVSRRSKPSSRTAFIGEQPNPWELLHPQDAMSRHRTSFAIHAFAWRRLCLHPVVDFSSLSIQQLAFSFLPTSMI